MGRRAVCVLASIGLVALFGACKETSQREQVLLSDFLISEPPQRGVLIIPDTLDVVLDQSLDSDSGVDYLHVRGGLLCPEEGGNFRLSLSALLVDGDKAEFTCGSSLRPFSGRLEIHLRRGALAADVLLPEVSNSLRRDLGQKVVGAINGGTLSLHGQRKSPTWLRLNQDIYPFASREIVLESPTNWEVGDEIAIGPSGFDFLEAESFFIQEISADGQRLVLDRPPEHYHHGRRQVVEDFVLDHRAEVGNLTRNILITSEDGLNQEFGGHLIITREGRGRLDSVEFRHMGQMGELGKYPFHWHHSHEARGQYIRNSSLHRSFNRCIVIHGTNAAEVTNNFCFDHFGHGFFFENGDEVRNIVHGNLGMLTRRVPEGRELLISDVRSPQDNRFSAPATYWVTNPYNDIQDNVASGSEGSGFWMSFVPGLDCSGHHCMLVEESQATIRPRRMATLAFHNNVAHSTLNGFTWDGAHTGARRDNPRNPMMDRELENAHYFAPQTPTFRGLVAYKNTNSGIYTRGNLMRFEDCVLADNGFSAFMAFTTEFQNCLFVGESENFGPRDLETQLHFRSERRVHRVGRPFVGLRVYDGPLYLNQVHFHNFPAQETHYGDWDYTPTPFVLIGAAARYQSEVEGLSFSPFPVRPVDFRDETPAQVNWQDAYSASILDREGSLHGWPGRLLRPDHPLNRDPNCFSTQGLNALSCDYQISKLRLGFNMPTPVSSLQQTNNYIKFNVVRSDGARQDFSPSPRDFKNNNKVTMIQQGYSYRLEDFELPPRARLRLFFHSPAAGDISPLITLEGLGHCEVEGYEVRGLGQLRAGGLRGQLSLGGDLHLRLEATEVREPEAAFGPKGQAILSLQCK